MAVHIQLPSDWAQLREDARVEFICGEFERAWLHGDDQRIEDYLDTDIGLDREQLCVQLCSLEKRLRAERGQDIALSDYPNRFPEYETALVRHFNQDESADATVESTVIFDSPKATLRAGLDLPLSEHRQFGRYQSEELLGRGAFGEVWRASDPLLHRKVAIKCRRADRPAPAGSADLFLDEARRLALLDHPRIVRVYDVGLQDGVPYIVSQLIEGETLSDRMRGVSLNHQESARIVAQVSEAAHAAHLQGIIHRDIKPANIILDSRGNAYLADFGLAVTEQEQLREPGGTMGTFAYMSPEQFRGESHLTDSRADVYSLGAVLYRLLTGRNVFVAESFEQFREQALSREVRPPRTIDDLIPESLERICLRCLNREISARYTTARDLANALAVAIGKDRPTNRLGRRLALSAAVVIVAIVGAWQFFANGKPHIEGRDDSHNPPAERPAARRSDEPGISRRQPPKLRDLAVIDDAYGIAPIPWTFSGIPVDWRALQRGQVLRADCGGAALVALAQLEGGETHIELDFAQLRWVGGFGIAYGAGSEDGDIRATTTFEALDIGPRSDGGWEVFRVMCSQANLNPADGWNTRTIETFVIEPPSEDSLPVQLTLQAGRLSDLVISGKKIELVLSTPAIDEKPDGGIFGLILKRAGVQVSKLKINGKRVKFLE
jgi:hypothetical protein